MLLGELLPPHGITSAAELGRRLGVARQHAWLLWTGRYLPNHETLQALVKMGVPAADLAQLERASPAQEPKKAKKGAHRRQPKKHESAGDMARRIIEAEGGADATVIQ
jgi:transcriptional regulator with XRE-family HTH domain